MSLANPAISTEAERPQPSIFEGKLKGYQLKVYTCRWLPWKCHCVEQSFCFYYVELDKAIFHVYLMFMIKPCYRLNGER